MELHILGSGSCIVSQERTSSGYLIENEDKMIMMDTGTSTTEALRKKGVSTAELDAIVNTHRHPDHISDLVPIIQDKIVRSFQEEEPGIKLCGPQGHSDYLESRIYHEMKEDIHEFESLFGFQVEVDELENLSQIEGLEIEIFEADHGPEGFKCVSIMFYGDKNIFFTGDTGYFEGLSRNAEGADIVIADCSKPDHDKVDGHMTPSECAKIARDAGADKLVLSHLYPEAERTDIKDSASKIYDGDIIVAEDLMEI